MFADFQDSQSFLELDADIELCDCCADADTIGTLRTFKHAEHPDESICNACLSAGCDPDLGPCQRKTF